jgi:hypothetical protein
VPLETTNEIQIATTFQAYNGSASTRGDLQHGSVESLQSVLHKLETFVLCFGDINKGDSDNMGVIFN